MVPWSPPLPHTRSRTATVECKVIFGEKTDSAQNALAKRGEIESRRVSHLFLCIACVVLLFLQPFINSQPDFLAPCA